jgi:hypothetical protein
VYAKKGGREKIKENPRGGQTQKTLRGGHYKKVPKKKKNKNRGRRD